MKLNKSKDLENKIIFGIIEYSEAYSPSSVLA